ncbi:flavodoxin family protein [Paenibacillus puldeungensis]|uniref:Flavodoxin family protein n=1 Tax=Paenibacillus puldeungensis TaxID=696536 RepID=A0ABW3RRG4_9BACL
MKKVTAFMGSARKKATYEAVREFEKYMKSYTEIDLEYVWLKDYRLDYCIGCKQCFDKGEQFCPLRDDRDLLIDKINHSDGVIFATPNYSFHVSAPMKNLLDRLAFIFHRPRFFGKASTAIVTQGIFGGGAIVKYLGNMGENFGFRVSKGCALKTLEPITTAIRDKNSHKIKKAAARFYKVLMHPEPPSPSFFRLMMFRMSRTSMKVMLSDKYCDYRHYKEKGWFESDYYYDVSLGPVKKLAGRIFDYMGRLMSRQN